jgi:hypothetical protein
MTNIMHNHKYIKSMIYVIELNFKLPLDAAVELMFY